MTHKVDNLKHSRTKYSSSRLPSMLISQEIAFKSNANKQSKMNNVYGYIKKILLSNTNEKNTPLTWWQLSDGRNPHHQHGNSFSVLTAFRSFLLLRSHCFFSNEVHEIRSWWFISFIMQPFHRSTGAFFIKVIILGWSILISIWNPNRIYIHNRTKKYLHKVKWHFHCFQQWINITNPIKRVKCSNAAVFHYIFGLSLQLENVKIPWIPITGWVKRILVWAVNVIITYENNQVGSRMKMSYESVNASSLSLSWHSHVLHF